MSGIIPRTPFLEETSALFTDEKTASARAKVIEWLDETAVGNATTKCNNLAKIQEILLSSHVELLEEFLENILTFSHDTSPEVRKALIGFIEQICKIQINFLPRMVNILAMLLKDPSPQVVKRVIQGCASIYKNSLQWLISSASEEISDDAEQAWNVLRLMKAEILDMIDHDNDGIRTNAVKFLEGIVIIQTYPDEDSMKRDNDLSLEDIPMTLKIARRRTLEVEALHIFDCLLKFHAAVHISSVNLITCTGTIVTIAKMRPSLMSPVIEALKNLHSNYPPTLTDSQISSVRKQLKMNLLTLLKHRGSYEMQSTIINLLQDLGASNQEISRAIPKMDKQEQQKRSSRRNQESIPSSKRQKLEQPKIDRPLPIDSRPMEIDYEELDEQKKKSNKLNEEFVAANLKSLGNVVQLVMTSMNNLPNEPTVHFLNTYTPIVDMSINQQITKISGMLGEQMTDHRVGPGASALSKDPPMRPCVSLDEERSIIQSARREVEPVQEAEDDAIEDLDSIIKMDDQQRKEEATKKLRENMERAKGEAIIQRMKMRVKSLKLQEVTKPMTRSTKEQFMIGAVERILNAERSCIIGGVSSKRRKILTVMAATFPDGIRELVLKFIMEDVKNRLDLAFSWLYEEYCLLQGFTRHSYIKTEHKPDHSYNQLLSQLIKGIVNSSEYKEKIILLRRIYLESPLLPDPAVSHLISMCELEDMSHHCLELVKDLTVRRPPRKQKFLKVLLTFCVHENAAIRDKAIDNIITLYAVHKILTNKIEEFALEWLGYLEVEKPPAAIFNIEYSRPEVREIWTEDLAKICLTVLFALMPYHGELLQKLSKVYVTANADMKRTILRAIESPIRKMGPDSFEILRLIEECPKGVETLVTRIIYILTEKTMPAPELVNRVRELYQKKVTDVRILIPILAGLSKKEVLTALPKILKLNPIVVKEVFNRLLGIGAEFANLTMPITANEILVALHTIDPSKCELKFIVKATSICLAEKDVYTQDVLAICLQQLVEITPTPTLLMRTVIQSLTLYPRLSAFIVNLLHRLVLKQVWKQKLIWDGFLKCSQRLKPQSLSVLIQLPPVQLQDALHQCPDLRQPLLDYAQNITETQVGQLSLTTMDILTGSSQDVYITDDTGGYIQIENIKKEKEDPDYLFSATTTVTSNPATAIASTTGQPLPPGEE